MFAAVQDGSNNRFYKSDVTGTTWTNITSTVLNGLTANGPVGMCHVLRDGSTIVLGWIGVAFCAGTIVTVPSASADGST